MASPKSWWTFKALYIVGNLKVTLHSACWWEATGGVTCCQWDNVGPLLVTVHKSGAAPNRKMTCSDEFVVSVYNLKTTEKPAVIRTGVNSDLFLYFTMELPTTHTPKLRIEMGEEEIEIILDMIRSKHVLWVPDMVSWVVIVICWLVASQVELENNSTAGINASCNYCSEDQVALLHYSGGAIVVDRVVTPANLSQQTWKNTWYILMF